MANNNDLMNATNGSRQVQKGNVQSATIKGLMESPAMQKKFGEVLKGKAKGFTTSVLNLVNSDSYLADAQPMSIITGAMVAATLDLQIDKNLGYAYLVPFNTKNKATGKWEKKANFVLGYKGYIQLAQRSGQYKSINLVTVYEGQVKSWNPLTEELDYDPNSRTSDKVIGYVGRFQLLNGFTKTTYWTWDEVEAHRIANNKDRDKKKLSGVWKTNYDAMAQKTVLRSLLSKWGILSIDMQTAVKSDETASVIDDSDELVKDPTVLDNVEEEDEPAKQEDESKDVPDNVNAETGEIRDGKTSDNSTVLDGFNEAMKDTAK
ncbi:recombinase RecT [Pediococcus inopinatus]